MNDNDDSIGSNVAYTRLTTRKGRTGVCCDAGVTVTVVVEPLELLPLAGLGAGDGNVAVPLPFAVGNAAAAAVDVAAAIDYNGIIQTS